MAWGRTLVVSRANSQSEVRAEAVGVGSSAWFGAGPSIDLRGFTAPTKRMENLCKADTGFFLCVNHCEITLRSFRAASTSERKQSRAVT